MLYLSVQIWFWIALAAAIGIVVGVRLQRHGAGQPIATVELAAREAAERLERELRAALDDAAAARERAEAMTGRVAELEARLAEAEAASQGGDDGQAARISELEARLAEAGRAVPETEVVELRERIAILERDLEAALMVEDDEPGDEAPATADAYADEEDDEVPVAVAHYGDGDEAVPSYGLAAPRGVPDDLKRISGIGAKLEERLNGIGVFHYRQIAGFSAEDVAWIDERLKTRGRISREDWPGQAAALLEARADAA